MNNLQVKFERDPTKTAVCFVATRQSAMDNHTWTAHYYIPFNAVVRDNKMFW